MAKQSGRQKEVVGRVMHEFKHGELETGGRKVRNPRQAIAIGLSEAGASNRNSPTENRRNRARTETKERKGQTAQQLKEGRSTETSTKPGAKTSSKTASRSVRASVRPASRGSKAGVATRDTAKGREPTRAQLYAETRRRGLTGCSRMSKADLERVLRRH